MGDCNKLQLSLLPRVHSQRGRGRGEGLSGVPGEVLPPRPGPGPREQLPGN